MRRFLLSSVIILGLIFNAIGIGVSFLVQSVYSSGQTTTTLQPIIENGYNSSKVVILAFDDSPKNQFILAKPILDKYGFKGSFFTVCNYVNNATAGVNDSYMTWQDIKILQKQGHDIESHSMTHTNLDSKSEQNLVYEIGGSKQCLLDHGINSTIFSYPRSTGHSNPTVVKVVSKYYDLARIANAPLAFLHCNGYKKEKDCRPFNNKGHPAYEGRYDIREWGHRPNIKGYQPSTNSIVPSFTQSQMFSQFLKEVNSQQNYNKNGCIVAIPIVVYHKIVPGNIVYTRTSLTLM
jgi:peptidoglycan/xylan/chitin deacetylase (PgdA/CDA1 family)